eukprot:symbB.v1.2.008546.t1/scaffold538.1/size242405/13
MFLEGEAPIDLTPDTGRLVLFWANEIPHEEFIAYMLSEGSKPEDIIQRAKKLPSKSLSTVAAVVGATSNAEALEGIERLSSSDLERLRDSMGKMGLN